MILVTESPTKESLVTGEESEQFPLVQISQYLVKVLPLRTPNFISDLLWSQPRTSQEFYLMFRNIVIEEDHAAVFVRGRTSRTSPFCMKERASRIASGTINPLYS